MIKNVILDMDGTLIDTERMYLPLMDMMGVHLGLDVGEKDYHLFFGKGVKYRILALKEYFHLSQSYEELQALYDSICVNEFVPRPYTELVYPDTMDCLKYLKTKGYNLYVCSNSIKYCVDKAMYDTGIVDYLIGYSDRDSCGVEKPNPYAYDYLINKYNIKKEETVSVEDSSVGVKTAKDAGVFIYGLQRESFTDLSEADVIIDSLLDLNKYL